jgi:hypothetical protein
MKPDSVEYFAQLVMAALEEPTNAALARERDAVLEVHPEWEAWEARRHQIEADWHAAQLAIGGPPRKADLDAAPELPEALEDRLMGSHRAAKPPAPNSRFPASAWMRYAAVFAVFLGGLWALSSLVSQGNTSESWTIQLAENSASPPTLQFSEEGWTTTGDLDALDAKTRSFAAALTEEHKEPHLSTYRSSGEIEIWSPRGIRRDGSAALWLAAEPRSALHYTISRLSDESQTWESSVQAAASGIATAPFPTDLPPGLYSLEVREAGSSLKVSTARFIIESSIAPNLTEVSEAPLAVRAVEAWLAPNPALGDILAALLENVNEPGVPQILRALAETRDLPRLQQWAAAPQR